MKLFCHTTLCIAPVYKLDLKGVVLVELGGGVGGGSEELRRGTSLKRCVFMLIDEK